jgi:hypothetical protein
MWYRLNPSETRMRPLLLSLLLIAALACAGCLKVYEAGISVSAGATANWTTADTPPELAFTVSNDHGKAIGAILVTIDLEVTSGRSPKDKTHLRLRSTPTGVTGEGGAWRIAGLQSGQKVIFKPETAFEPGSYRLTATITPEASVKERSTDDNVATMSFTVAAAPEVAGLNLSVAPDTATVITPVGTDIEFRLPVTVTGPSGSVAHLVRFDIITSNQDMGWHVYRSLAASPTGQVHSVALKAVAPEGAGQIVIVVDPSEYLVETNEDDNVSSFNWPTTTAK